MTTRARVVRVKLISCSIISRQCALLLSSQVGEIRAHAAEWTANVSAEFKETRRRMSVEIYDKFQRAASIKRKLSSELGFSPAPELTLPRRTLSVNFRDEREEKESGLQALATPLARNGAPAMNAFDPEKGDVSLLRHLKSTEEGQKPL